MSNLVKAVLILNAKKGWSDSARKKSAAKRKRMSFTEFREKTLAKAGKSAQKLFKESDKLYDKGQNLISESNQVWGSRSDTLYKKADRTMRKGDAALYQASSLERRIKKIRERYPTSNKKKSQGKCCPDCGTTMKNGKCPECDSEEMTENVGKKGRKGGKGWSEAARKKAAMVRKRMTDSNKVERNARKEFPVGSTFKIKFNGKTIKTKVLGHRAGSIIWRGPDGWKRLEGLDRTFAKLNPVKRSALAGAKKVAKAAKAGAKPDRSKGKGDGKVMSAESIRRYYGLPKKAARKMINRPGASITMTHKSEVGQRGGASEYKVKIKKVKGGHQAFVDGNNTESPIHKTPGAALRALKKAGFQIKK